MAKVWGVSPDEQQLSFKCDEAHSSRAEAYWRGIAVNASAEVVFRWLCQLRAAPYSYDWLDNLGRQSPQQLVVGLDQLVVGQTFMTIFQLTHFVPHQELTLRWRRCTMTYKILPVAAGEVRLVVKIRVEWPKLPLMNLVSTAFAAGDLFMMKKQLQNLKRLSEASPALCEPPLRR
jgi:hypothetical protein